VQLVTDTTDVDAPVAGTGDREGLQGVGGRVGRQALVLVVQVPPPAVAGQAVDGGVLRQVLQQGGAGLAEDVAHGHGLGPRCRALARGERAARGQEVVEGAELVDPRPAAVVLPGGDDGTADAHGGRQVVLAHASRHPQAGDLGPEGPSSVDHVT
jgi:hypothetical protein